MKSGSRIKKNIIRNKIKLFKESHRQRTCPKDSYGAIYNLSTGRLKMLNLYGNGLIGRVNVIWDSVLAEVDPGVWEYVYKRKDERYYYLKDHLACPPKLQRRRRSI